MDAPSHTPSILLFDLSEVLIAGLVGVESMLAPRVGEDEDDVLKELGGPALVELCLGRCTETQYLRIVLERTDWPISAEDLKVLVRTNFHHVIETMPVLVEQLAERITLALVSDHAREWIEYIEAAHGFLAYFSQRIYSYDTGFVKSQPAAFEVLLERLACEAGDCLFIDDSPANVAAAESIGIRSIRFEGQGALTRRLAATGIVTLER